MLNHINQPVGIKTGQVKTALTFRDFAETETKTTKYKVGIE